MSPEAVRARTEIYGSPGSGWLMASMPIASRPETELRSSQVASRSATPTLTEPDAERISTDPVVELTVTSPEPEPAWRSARFSEVMSM